MTQPLTLSVTWAKHLLELHTNKNTDLLDEATLAGVLESYAGAAHFNLLQSARNKAIEEVSLFIKNLQLWKLDRDNLSTRILHLRHKMEAKV